MSPLILFLIEKTIVNIAPILLGAGIAARLLGWLLVRTSASWGVRAATYSAIGAAAGLWSYSAFDVSDRSLELAEGVSLYVSMFILCIAIVGTIVFLAERRNARRTTAHGAAE